MTLLVPLAILILLRAAGMTWLLLPLLILITVLALLQAAVTPQALAQVLWSTSVRGHHTEPAGKKTVQPFAITNLMPFAVGWIAIMVFLTEDGHRLGRREAALRRAAGAQLRVLRPVE